MRKLIILACGLMLSSTLSAQLEVKANPLGLLFGNFNALVEKGMSDNFGLEGQVGFAFRDNSLSNVNYKYSALGLGVAGKYYLNPREGWDRFYVGGYARFGAGNWKVDGGTDDQKYKSTRLSLGLIVGQKWVSEGGFVFEVGAGAGRAFINKIDNDALKDLNFDLDILIRLAVGYRFQ